MTQTLSMSHTFGKYTLTLRTDPSFGPEIYMSRELEVMGLAKYGIYPGGVVYHARLNRAAPPEARADVVYFYMKDIVHADLLVGVLTQPGAGLMVDASDDAGDVQALRGWLREAIEAGQDWREMMRA